jgi:hypothetical protein
MGVIRDDPRLVQVAPPMGVIRDDPRLVPVAPPMGVIRDWCRWRPTMALIRDLCGTTEV